jgi:hypothetical protein
MGKNIGADTSQFEQERGGWMAGLLFAFMIYIVLLVLTFTMKTKVKILGIILLAGGVINKAITNLWGIIALALLVPADVVALRYKPSTTPSNTGTAAGFLSQQQLVKGNCSNKGTALSLGKQTRPHRSRELQTHIN